jgi:hypothetical protein
LPFPDLILYGPAELATQNSPKQLGRRIAAEHAAGVSHREGSACLPRHGHQAATSPGLGDAVSQRPLHDAADLPEHRHTGGLDELDGHLVRPASLALPGGRKGTGKLADPLAQRQANRQRRKGQLLPPVGDPAAKLFGRDRDGTWPKVGLEPLPPQVADLLRGSCHVAVREAKDRESTGAATPLPARQLLDQVPKRPESASGGLGAHENGALIQPKDEV